MCLSFIKNCDTVQIILMSMQIGFVFFKQNIISYLFLLILVWNVTQWCSWQVLDPHYYRKWLAVHSLQGLI